MSIDWPALRAAATVVAGHAYAPYSRLRVGAAGVAPDGTVVTGCNVENASFGLTLCAECGLVSALHAAGLDRLVAVSVVGGDGAPMAPCGRCRQLLIEAGGPGLLLDADGGPQRLGDLLPGAFSGIDLSDRREGGAETGAARAPGGPTARTAGPAGAPDGTAGGARARA